jgi:hypothetical protein
VDVATGVGDEVVPVPAGVLAVQREQLGGLGDGDQLQLLDLLGGLGLGGLGGVEGVEHALLLADLHADAGDDALLFGDLGVQLDGERGLGGGHGVLSRRGSLPGLT